MFVSKGRWCIKAILFKAASAVPCLYHWLLQACRIGAFQASSDPDSPSNMSPLGSHSPKMGDVVLTVLERITKYLFS
ncbi:hypothetical protein BKA61DRAFT_625496 [Leptodontidium sp. MPI-SDFR-AT-0119]|nr:hypothetical protein BKA61DRAFT_625496 [Leptodontidium sp. MPI-SDFR-AT-0119]